MKTSYEKKSVVVVLHRYQKLKVFAVVNLQSRLNLGSRKNVKALSGFAKEKGLGTAKVDPRCGSIPEYTVCGVTATALKPEAWPIKRGGPCRAVLD